MSSAATGGRNAEIQDRDLQVLRGLFEARVMTAEHVAAATFGGRYEAARKRLQKLKAAGFVSERPRRAYDPAVMFLTKKGFAALCQAGTISDLPRMSWESLERRVHVSELTLRHELEVQDVRAAFYRAATRGEAITISAFETWPTLYQFESFGPTGEVTTVKPDGFARLQEQNAKGDCFDHLFYLEVDRSTEPQQTLAARAFCYRDFYRRGGLAVRAGQPASEFERYPFRVLFVLKNAERRNNTAERLLLSRPPILTQIWCTTFEEVVTDPLAAIWVRPVDYRDSVRGSQYETARESAIYRRQIGREALVEQAVTKRRLFDQTV